MIKKEISKNFIIIFEVFSLFSGGLVFYSEETGTSQQKKHQTRIRKINSE
ncbi:MAG: hypothetical protein AB7P13_03960 [Candidatus Nitrosocosmicus sp.]|jgi:hypothetical protein